MLESVKNSQSRELSKSLSAHNLFHKDVLLNLLIKVDGILNSKLLGYISSDFADDASLPQVTYASDNLTKEVGATVR